MLTYAFSELRLNKYNSRCLATNEAVIKHLSRLNCKQEGLLRENRYINGKFVDEVLFGLTKTEFLTYF